MRSERDGHVFSFRRRQQLYGAFESAETVVDDVSARLGRLERRARPADHFCSLAAIASAS